MNPVRRIAWGKSTASSPHLFRPIHFASQSGKWDESPILSDSVRLYKLVIIGGLLSTLTTSHRSIIVPVGSALACTTDRETVRADDDDDAGAWGACPSVDGGAPGLPRATPEATRAGLGLAVGE